MLPGSKNCAMTSRYIMSVRTPRDIFIDGASDFDAG